MYLHPLFVALPPRARGSLVRSSTFRSYRRNEVVVVADQVSAHAYCVATGLLRVVLQGTIKSRGAITTDFLGRGGLYFNPSLLENSYRAPSTLIATLPSSVYLIPMSALNRICFHYPGVAIELLNLTVKRAAAARNRLMRVSSLSSTELVRQALQELARLAPAVGGCDRRITQAVIASYTGLSRERVNKAMRELEDRGLMRRDREAIHVFQEAGCCDL